MDTPIRRLSRRVLLVLAAVVAVTSLLGGGVLLLGSVVPLGDTPIVPPGRFLAGSVFASYLVPGVVLFAVVGGLHIAVFVLTWRRRPAAPLVGAVASFGLLIWIFVELIVIPFSALQAVYQAIGIAELAAIFGLLGVLDPFEGRRPRPAGPTSVVQASPSGRQRSPER